MLGAQEAVRAVLEVVLEAWEVQGVLEALLVVREGICCAKVAIAPWKWCCSYSRGFSLQFC